MTAEEIYEHKNKFYPCRVDGNDTMPKGVKLTVWVDGGNFETQGYLENVTTDELGLEALIAKSWIRQSELEKLSTTY